MDVPKTVAALLRACISAPSLHFCSEAKWLEKSCNKNVVKGQETTSNQVQGDPFPLFLELMELLVVKTCPEQAGAVQEVSDTES